ncbi:cytidine deaminase [bacterium]|nr:cytidine deaminase [bacterium]UNM09279.1 MAG: cytidine deaminase [Planctomycetales bacterium]
MKLSAEQRDAMLAAAMLVRSQAHAPYSRFRVGAAVLSSSGRVFLGCNVENLSYGLSCCAERNAIAAAVAGGMQPGGLAAVVVVGDTPEPISPCGACRQVIAEFAAADCSITGANLAGQTRSWTIDGLLPDRFKAEL